MRTAAISLWALQAAASLIAVIAALTNFESIVVTGPILAITGLLLGTVTNCLGSPLVLIHALSGPHVCSIGALLIAANHWGPQEARWPITAILILYVAISIPIAVFALQRIRRLPSEVPPGQRFKWQFSLKAVLILMTAVCMLITAGKLMMQYLPEYPSGLLLNSYWPGFGGFAFVTLLLSAVVFRHFLALRRRNIADTPVEWAGDSAAASRD
jgi:hypothetical protein